MKSKWLITTAAIAILASTGLAGAQGMNERSGGASQGGATEKSSPAPRSQMQGAEPRQGNTQTQRNGMQGQTTGQSPQADSPSRQQRGDQMDRQKQPSGAAQQHDRDTQKSGTAGQEKQQRTGADQKQERQQRTGADQKHERMGAEQRNGTQKQGSDTRTRTETTGRGDAQGATLTTEQRTKIREVVVSKKIPRVTNVNFSISVGAKVPRTVQFHPIPAEIVEIHPAWRPYRVILVSDELIIVNPSTFEIVAVVAV
jgi:hypothetical protein